MNQENVKLSIQVMERAQNLQMEYWQVQQGGSVPLSPVHSIEELHACGNKACFAGYLAISGIPGWGINKFCEPVYHYKGYGRVGYDAVADFLEVSSATAFRLVMGSVAGGYAYFYGKPFAEVTPADVIAKLELILAGELE